MIESNFSCCDELHRDGEYIESVVAKGRESTRSSPQLLNEGCIYLNYRINIDSNSMVFPFILATFALEDYMPSFLYMCAMGLSFCLNFCLKFVF